jgi:N6-adenosine-specific RNA methylase IME4
MRRRWRRGDFCEFNEHDVHFGLGHTTRKSTETCFLGRRGRPKRLSRAVREVIIAPVREHSRKPDEQYSRIEAFCEGPRLELFARQRVPGWVPWGNEIDKFTAEGAAPKAIDRAKEPLRSGKGRRALITPAAMKDRANM